MAKTKAPAKRKTPDAEAKPDAPSGTPAAKPDAPSKTPAARARPKAPSKTPDAEATAAPQRDDAADVGGALDAAQAAIVQQRYDAALKQLLAAWRACRHERLAELVERTSRHVTRRPIGTGGTLAAMNERWRELAEKRDPLDVPRLLASLASGRSQAAVARIALLAEFPDDPRVAMGLAQYVAMPPYSSIAGSLATIITVLARIAHPPALAFLASHRGRDEVDEVLARLAPAMANRAPVELAADRAETCAAIAARLPDTTSGDALLEAIYANPDDDAPRTVYADWLAERADPRGELISLQLLATRGPLAPEAAARERELLDKHGREWAGAIAKVSDARTRVFARGFVEACTIEPKNGRTMVAAASAREWSTVTHLVLKSEVYVPDEVFAEPAFRNVRSFRMIGAGALARLASGPPCRLEHVELWIDEERLGKLAAAFARCPGLPHLRRLDLQGRALSAAGIDALLRSEGGRRLTSLAVHGEAEQLASYLAVTHPSSLLELRSTWQYIVPIRIHRRAADELWHLEVPTVVLDEALTTLTRGFAGADRWIARIEATGSPETRARMEAMLAPVLPLVTWV